MRKFSFKIILLLLMVLSPIMSFMKLHPRSEGAIERTYASTAQNVYNNAIFIDFKNEDGSWIDNKPTGYSEDWEDLYNYVVNESPNSVVEYYKTMSYNKINLQTNFYKNGTKAIISDYTLNELIPYSPTNTMGYFEWEVCSYPASIPEPSFLSSEYLSDCAHLLNVYECQKYNDEHNSACDLDASDKIVCMCGAKNYENSSNLKLALYEHGEHYFRLMLALKKIVVDAKGQFSGELDWNDDGFVDMITFVFPETEDNLVNWGDLLWAHKGVMNYLSYLPSSVTAVINLIGYNGLATMFSNRGIRGLSADEVEFLLTDIKLGSLKFNDYILMTSEHSLPTRPLIDDANKKVIKNFTFAHELGHALGLPDYYVYDEDQEENAVRYMDIMGYSYDGFPTYLTTYSRELLGFTNSNNVVELTRAGTYTLKPTTYDEVNNAGANSNNVLAYYYEDPDYEGQKIYIEYRVKQGKFEDSAYYSEDGLIIYRADNDVTPAPEFSSLKTTGNFYGYPYGLYMFRNNTSSTSSNLNYNPGIYNVGDTFGNSNANSIVNAITFQTYNKSQDQEELKKSDVTFINSGLVIKNISIQNGEISFEIEGGKLKPQVDLSNITLNGTNTVEFNVKSGNYTDAGINYAGYSSSDFTISVENNVNVDGIGTYTYTYNLTHKESGLQKTLTRTVKVVDKVKPVITLKGGQVEVYSKEEYIEPGYSAEDNYDSSVSVQVSWSELDNSTKSYTITYTATDSSGNVATTTRIVKIVQMQGTIDDVKLKGLSTVNCEVKTQYTDAGVNYAGYSSSDFTVSIKNNVNTNVLGTYTYVYTIAHKQSGQQKTLTRTVKVLDTTKPSLNISGNSTIYKDELRTLLNNDFYSFSDNYTATNHLIFERTPESFESLMQGVLPENFDQYLKIKYSVTDESGNKTEKIRTITFQYDKLTENNFKLTATTYSNSSYLVAGDIIFKLSNLTLNNERYEPVKNIDWYINGVVQPELSQYGYQSIMIPLRSPGTYLIEIEINGEILVSKNIEVYDSAAPKNEAGGATNTSLFVILGVILAVVMVLIPTIKAINKKRNDLDRY